MSELDPKQDADPTATPSVADTGSEPDGSVDGGTSDGEGSGMVMPPPTSDAIGPVEAGDAGSLGGQGSDDDPQIIIAPPSAGRQVLQLVLIPALICLTAIGGMFLLYKMMHRADTLETVMLRLRTSSGSGKLGMGLHDPRYQDRCRAAMSLAEMLPKIEDEKQRGDIGQDLLAILRESITEEEPELESYMLMAIGQLGPEGGLTEISTRCGSPHALVRFSAARSLAIWPDPAAARAALPDLIKLFSDDETSIASEAVRVAGILVKASDTEVIDKLREAMTETSMQRREVQWNAAAALARQGEKGASQIVAQLLLDRKALSELPAAVTGPGAQQKMPKVTQDRVMIATLATLAADTKMTDSEVWAKIQKLADEDPSMSVKKAAKALLAIRNSERAGDHQTGPAKGETPEDVQIEGREDDQAPGGEKSD